MHDNFYIIYIFELWSKSLSSYFLYTTGTTFHKYFNNEFHEYIQDTNEDIISNMQIKVYAGYLLFVHFVSFLSWHQIQFKFFYFYHSLIPSNWLYHRKSFETVVINNIPMTTPDVIYQYINQLKPLVIYVHGFREVPANESIHTIIAGNEW